MNRMQCCKLSSKQESHTIRRPLGLPAVAVGGVSEGAEKKAQQ